MSPTFDLSCVPSLNDELNGDPDVLDRMVGIFRTNADVMNKSAENLQRLRSGTSEMQSLAFEAAAVKAHEVETGIRSAAYYYQQVANAVAGFSPVLREAQRKAPAHLDSLHRAQGGSALAEADHERARHLARNVDPAVQQQGVDLANEASRRYQGAQTALSEARSALVAAAAQVKEANDAAAAKVNAATENAGLKDSFWDYLEKFGKVIGEALVAIGKFIWENLDTILLVLSIVSFFIPGGTALFTALRVVVTAVKILSAIKSAIELAQEGWSIVEAVKTGDWGTAGRKVVGVAAGFALSYATKKLGRVAGRATGKALYSLDKSGKLTTTTTGRAINQLVTKLGPEIRNVDGSAPVRYMSRSIDRTTQVITNVSEWTYNKGIKLVTTPLVENLKKPPTEQAGRHAGGGGGGGSVGAW